MEKCFLLVFALVKESKQGQDKIILHLIVILSPPPPLIRFFSFRISASISIKCCKTKNKNNQSEMGPMRTQRKTRKPPEVRENAGNWVATSFESDCLRESCEVLEQWQSGVKQNQSNTESHLTFNWKFFCVTLSILCLTFVRSLEEMVTRGKVQW